MPNVQLFNDYSTDQAAIDRRRKMAEMLQAQSATPLETNNMAGGWVIPVSPFQGAAKILQGYSAGAAMRKADADQKALSERYNTEGQAALAKGLREWKGSPEVAAQAPATPNDDEGNPMPMVAGTPARAPDQNAAMATFGSHPMTQPYSAAMMAQALKQQEPYTLAADAKRMGPNGTVLADNPKPHEPPEVIRLQKELSGLSPYDPNRAGIEARIAHLTNVPADSKGKWGDPFSLGGATVQKNDVTGQIRQAVTREPQIKVHQDAPITAVTLQDPNNPNGTIIVDGRSGRMIGQGPKLTDAGKLENKRQFNMQGIGATIQEAEDTLTGKATGTKPTQSGVGTAVDAAGSLIGKSPAGAVEAAKLKAIGGALVSKVPRMEGPQSDKDVMLYKEMAGKVGDSTIPIDQRLGALETVKGIWSKYERLNPDAFADRRAGAAAPAGAWSVVK